MLSALLMATAIEIRNKLSLTKDECMVKLLARPPANVPERFILVHPLRWAPGDAEVHTGIDETYAIGALVCWRSRTIAYDRLEEGVYFDVLSSMEAMARKVIAAVHFNYDLINEANQLATRWSKSAMPIIEPLVWAGTDAEPQMHEAAWLWGDEDPTGREAAIAMDVRFVGARRLRDMADLQKELI